MQYRILLYRTLMDSNININENLNVKSIDI